jgi:manganese-dependent inorganic pyrophosphatase
MPSIIDEVLVVGHHDPDTVCSAVAYAAFYAWQTGEKAVVCHLDELNRESAWLLAHLGLPAPRAIKDVYLRVRDVMMTDAPKLRPDQTLREAGLLALPGVMSRKKQVVPTVAAALKEASAAAN